MKTTKLLTVQDISCYGQCSITVSLPILSAYGIETAILPSAVLSTHTGGFTDVTFHDLTEEMPKIMDHWIKEGIRFDAIYTGYIGNTRQFDFLLFYKDKLLKENGLWIIDPAMADHGKLYKSLNMATVDGMKKLCRTADYILPNITEACLLTGTEYRKIYDEAFLHTLLEKLIQLGCKTAILTGVIQKNTIGAMAYDGIKPIYISTERQNSSYHGTGDIFSSVVIANLLNKISLDKALEDAVAFVSQCIKETTDDASHTYGVKFEQVLKKKMKL